MPLQFKKEDTAKIVVLSAILVALLVYIGFRYSSLAREHRQRLAAAHQLLPQVSPPLVTGSARAALTGLPVSPPRRDPFNPLVPSGRQMSSPAASPSRPAGPAATQLPPSALFPPTLPPLFGPGQAPVTGVTPGPDVLYLSGIIKGNPDIAVLRRGENRYIVHQGDLIEGRYRVMAIGPGRVTLREGKNSYTLKLGG